MKYFIRDMFGWLFAFTLSAALMVIVILLYPLELIRRRREKR